jgi:hypothetical protein
MVRIIAGIGNRTSCKHSFVPLKILTLSSLYIYSILTYVVNNMNPYQFASDTHNRNTRHVLNLNLSQPQTHLSVYQKGSYCMGIRLFTCLPLNLKKLYTGVERFKSKLKEYLCLHSFYAVDEFIEYTSDRSDHI